MWLTGRLSPDFKTIADFRRSDGKAIRNVCSQFIVLCRNLHLFSKSIVAIDGSYLVTRAALSAKGATFESRPGGEAPAQESRRHWHFREKGYSAASPLNVTGMLTSLAENKRRWLRHASFQYREAS